MLNYFPTPIIARLSNYHFQNSPHLTLVFVSCLSLSACGGGSEAPSITKSETSVPTPIEAMTISGLTDNSLIAANESLVIKAQSADLTKATLLLNDVEILTINTAPFEFNSTNTAQLTDLAIGHHKIKVKGVVDNKEQTIDLNFRQDGEYLATYAATNYVYENSPYEQGSITDIDGTFYTAKNGSSTDLAATTVIENTNNDNLFITELADNQIDLSHQVTDGTYVVNLHFSEIWFNGTTRGGRGSRVFRVAVEDTLIADDLDIFAEVGYLSAYTITNDSVEVTDGELNIALTAVTNKAKISAYSVQRVLNAWDDEDGDTVLNFDDKCLGTPTDTEINELGCQLPPPDPEPSNNPVKINGGMFVEKDGLLVVEMESTDHSEGWKFETGRESIGAGYLNMLAPQAAWKPNNIKEIIKVRIKINNPGRYQFQWRNLITKPSVPSTEHNDSYLKIYADNFYGQKEQNIVCPKQLEPENKCVPVGRKLEGEAALGYFKIFRSGGPIDEWKWSTYTSDNDGHTIFAEFNSAGEYEVEIANRSDFHAIDRFVLFKDGNDSNNVVKSLALELTTAESAREP